MRRPRPVPIWLIVAYSMIALPTFGIAAERYSRDAWARYSACESVALNRPNRIDTCREPGNFEAPITGLVSAALWPLWWSWTLVEGISS